MGSGSGVLASFDDYERALSPGFFWVDLHEGDHFSTDVAVVDGQAVWSRYTKGYPLNEGTFDYWAEMHDDDQALKA